MTYQDHDDDFKPLGIPRTTSFLGGVVDKTTILYLPQGSGKTALAPQIAAQLGCESVVDEWSADQPLTPNALHLTNDIRAWRGQ